MPTRLRVFVFSPCLPAPDSTLISRPMNALLERPAIRQRAAQQSVKEYWIVCPEEKCVEVYRLPGPQGYGEQVVVTPPVILESSALPCVKVNLAEVLG